MEEHLQIMTQELADGKAQLVDVREQYEWDEGHLKQAWLAPLSELQEGSVPQDLDPTKILYLHCRSGQRVYQAAPLLEELNFTNVVPLNEGFTTLVDEGFEQA